MKTEVIQLWFMRLTLILVFRLIDDVIMPNYRSAIPDVKKWDWMLRECNRLVKIIESSPVYVVEEV